MAFLAFFIIGIVTYKAIPVTLLPSVDIPHVTVRISAANTSARELENTATAHVRRQLQQVAGLKEIHSESRDGSATIRMDFDYGVDIDLAFIAVNEKIDATMNLLPRDMERPKAIKASATDIPVLYLSMTLREGDDEERFLELAKVADSSVRHRLEQLPEVAMVDVTGVPSRMLRIVPDKARTEAAGITPAMIEGALTAANVAPGSMTVREGYYEYNVSVANRLRTPQDVADIYLRHGDRLIRLGDIASVETVEREPDGISEYGGKRAVTLAVIKQSEENIDRLKETLSAVIAEMEREYPEIAFAVTRNQTELLDYSISNLVQNLILGLILVFLLTALFLGDLRTPFVIGISIVTALVLTFLLFYLCHVSLNVVSLSGLILAVGMMIDNSVIVTENITRERQAGLPLAEACDRGTSEMITPLLSSSLTTVAVFVPLIFMSGIAGAIFADQAFSITAGLGVSYVVGIMLLPVLYKVFFTRRGKGGAAGKEIAWKTTDRTDRVMARLYNRGVDAVFAHKGIWLAATACVMPLCAVLFRVMDVERMPAIEQAETMVRIDWNENIDVRENARRAREAVEACGNEVVEHSASAGVQDYILDAGAGLSRSEAELYLRAAGPKERAELERKMAGVIARGWPEATVEFYPPDNIFEKIFASDESEVEARLTPRGARSCSDPAEYSALVERIAERAGEPALTAQTRVQTDIVADNRLMALYGVDPSETDRALRSAFREEAATTLRTFSEYMPVAVSTPKADLRTALAQTMVEAKRPEGTDAASAGKALIPLSALVTTSESTDFREIRAGKNGEYLPVAYEGTADPEATAEAVTAAVRETGGWDAELTGSFFSDSRMMEEMAMILLVSVVLMYFILCAQFESFLQPLIVLLEIPLDTAFALFTLWIFGFSLNIMSAIGIIVTCGIVVNDSILKLDAINGLRKEGLPLLQAIHTAGERRLRPIVMTSLTTIIAMVPMLFTDDMGSQLQRPLAVAMIGSMVVGTLVSIFIIPLVYYIIYRKHDNNVITAH